MIYSVMRELFQPVSEILLNDWDPIGVVDEPNAQDEYDEYANIICSMLHEGTSEAAIKDYLIKTETEWMKMRSNSECAANAARKIMSIRS